MAVLFDTSVLLSAALSKDSNHEHAAEIVRATKNEAQIVPVPVLVELFFLSIARLSYAQAVRIFAATHTTFQIEALTDADMTRMQTIMTKYADAELDYADTAIMALSERLNITRVCTFDRRDFSIFRPMHCDYLQLLP